MAEALNPVGVNTTFASGTTSAQSDPITMQSDSLRIVAETAGVYVAIGNSIKARVRVASLAEKAGLKLINVIDKRSIVSPTVKIGKNVWIKQGAIIERNSEIGSNVIVDSGCVVSHDVIISPNCHLSPGCRFGGTVFVGKNSIIGVGASISPYVKIGKYVILSPGSSVVNDIPDYSIVEGVPGRIIGSSKEKDKER